MDNYFGEQVLNELFGFGNKKKEPEKKVHSIEPIKAIEKAKVSLKQYLSSLKNNEHSPRWDELMIVKYLNSAQADKEQYEKFIENSEYNQRIYVPFAQFKAKSGLLGKPMYRGKDNSDLVISKYDLESIYENFAQSFFEHDGLRELEKDGYEVFYNEGKNGSSYFYIRK
mgnify:CR=1 FL=1